MLLRAAITAPPVINKAAIAKAHIGAAIPVTTYTKVDNRGAALRTGSEHLNVPMFHPNRQQRQKRPQKDRGESDCGGL